MRARFRRPGGNAGARGSHAVLSDRSPMGEAWGKFLGTLAAPLARRFQRQEEMLLLLFEDEPGHRDKLWTLRGSVEYEPAFSEAEPLVSVTIPTYTNWRRLLDRAIPSVLAQTYENFEVVVVGDAAPPETAEVVASFGDPRISYFNRPTRGPYPDQKEALWHTAGVPPWNEAVRRSRGHWIAPLNDDDTFRPEHIEVLLRAAQAGRHEVCYGRIEQRSPGGGVEIIGDRFPPEWSHFNWQSAIYHAGLTFWEMELGHALFGMPADWALCRRMLRAGVRFGAIEDVVAEWFPADEWGRPDDAPTG